MRDLVAALVALALIVAALSLATTLHFWRRRRDRAHASERAAGRIIVAEIPIGDELRLFTEDADHFYYGQEVVNKEDIAAVRVLINGAPIAAAVSARFARNERQPTSFEDRPEGIARDRWDVALETASKTVLVECGAIRERISQELARAVFESVKRDLERRNTRT